MIRPLLQKDRPKLLSLLIRSRVFTSQEIDVAMELVDIVLKNRDQKDYRASCFEEERDEVRGYLCYGPAPMTQGTFDLYWIVVDPDFQNRGVGSKLLRFLEDQVREAKGRMILVDTASIPSYAPAQRLYLRHGFREVARIADYYAEGNDRITFCKRLI